MDRRTIEAQRPNVELVPCPRCGGRVFLIGGETSPVPFCEACNVAWVPDLRHAVSLWWNATGGW